MSAAEAVVRDLRSRGDLWETAPGLIGLRGETFGLYRLIERTVAELALSETREELRVPGGISLATLARARYFASFPQWLTAAGHLSDDPEVLERVASSDDPAAAAAEAVQATEAALSPAVCYHAYEAFADRVISPPVLLTMQGTCWRHEGARLSPLERGWAFTMREFVCIGSADQVEAFRRSGTDRATRLAAALGLQSRIALAEDPFFAPTARGMALLQRVKELKHELLLPIAPDREIAAASFNHHESFFGEAFRIHLPDGAPAASGCVAFGIERWLLAFLVAHGTDAEGWPDIVNHQERHAEV